MLLTHDPFIVTTDVGTAEYLSGRKLLVLQFLFNVCSLFCLISFLLPLNYKFHNLKVIVNFPVTNYTLSVEGLNTCSLNERM